MNKVFNGLLFSALAVSWIGAAPTAKAADGPPPSLSAIAAQQTALRADVIAGRGAVKDLDKAQRDQLVIAQDRVLALVQGKTDVAELPEPERLELFNKIEWIKAAVTKADDERKVCQRVKTIGSNRVQVVCTTVAEQRRQREGAKESLSRPQMCNQPPCGGE